MQHQIFHNSYFFNKPNSSKAVPFMKSYFFRKATFWKQLIFQKIIIPQIPFPEEVFLELHFLFTATLLTVDSLYLCYILSWISSYLKQKPWLRGTLCSPQAFFLLSLSWTLSISNISLSQRYILFAGRFFFLYLEHFRTKFFYNTTK